MIGLVTPGCCATQASATWLDVAPCSCARAWTASSTLKAVSVKCGPLPFRVLSQAAPWRRPFTTAVFAAQKAPGQGGPRQQGQTIGLGHRDQLPLNPAIQEVIGLLLAHHPIEPEFFRHPQRFHQLPGSEGAGAEVAHRAAADEVV
jgi:hypothetical protein